MNNIERNKEEYAIGIDIGGTNFRIGLVSASGELAHFHIESSRVLYENGDSLSNLIRYVESYRASHPNIVVKGIGIGFPSVISKDKKTVYATTNIAGFDQVNVADPMEKALKVPVLLDNDVNYLLLTEIVKHKLDGQGIVLGFYLGTGLGNAIYYQDHFIAGKHGSAAELGHIPVLGAQDACPCGNNGCIEMYASGKTLQKLHEENFADTPFEELFVRHAQDELIVSFLDTFAIAIATEVNLLDPDYVILGGGVLQMKGFPKTVLEAAVYRYARKPYPAEDLNFLYAAENQEAGVLGAGHQVWKQFIPIRK